MLVIISDLHLTDGTSGETIRPGTFRAFRESLRELAYDASWRSDQKYVPIDGIDLVLLGDILDVIRSTRWCGAPAEVRPWGDQNDARFSDMVGSITEDVVRNNQQSLSILRSLHNPEILSLPPAAQDGGVTAKPPHRVPVPARSNGRWVFVMGMLVRSFFRLFPCADNLSATLVIFSQGHASHPPSHTSITGAQRPVERARHSKRESLLFHVRVAFETTKQHLQPTEGQPSERQHIPVNRCKQILHFARK